METKEMAATQQLAEARIGTAPLARQELGATILILPQAQWTQERVDLLKRQVCPAGISNDEFVLFLEMCKRTGLDPFLKQAYCTPRRVKINAGTRDERWVERFEFMAAEAGLAARCDQLPDYRGIRGAAVFEGDEFLIDSAGENVTHRFNPAKRQGKLVGAWAQAFREGRHIQITYLPLESRIQKKRDGTVTEFWSRMPEGMILKCARAEQYRLAYPAMFSGVYIREEMPEEEPHEERPAQQAKREPAKEQAKPLDPDQQKAVDKVKESLGVTSAAGPVAAFGEDGVKGKPLAELDVGQLNALERQGDDSLKKSPKARWAPAVRKNLEEIRAELAKRSKPADAVNFPKAKQEPQDAEWTPSDQPEPGSDFEPVQVPGGNNEEDVPF